MPEGPASHQLSQASLPRLDPKLRMMANGSETVNARRAELCSSLVIDSNELAESVKPVLMQGVAPPKPVEEFHRGHQQRIPDNLSVSVFIETIAPDVPPDMPAGTTLEGHRGRVYTAKVPLSALDELARSPSVLRVERGQALSTPRPAQNAQSVTQAAAEAASKQRELPLPDGVELQPVLVGIIDVGGFDFAHPDFLDADGKTRFVRIWDQGAEEGKGHPSPRDRDQDRRFAGRAVAASGAEIRQEELNQALAEADEAAVPPQALEPQSRMSVGSHGTHVASIAAGNGGICRHAYIAGVLLALTDDDEQRRRSFYDSTRVVHAVEYLLSLGEEYQCPVSINISLGTNGHAHDGSAATSRWIDGAMAEPGRIVSIAAGNAGQDVAEHDGDFGWTMGRIHTAGRIAARALETDLEWVVVGNGIDDVSENELELWYSAQDRFAVQLRPPGGAWIGPVKPREYIENQRLPPPLKGFISIYNELYHPSNGGNYIAIYLSPEFRRDTIVGVPAGVWTVRLLGEEVRDGSFDGWIERDDPRQIGRIGNREAWSFPSFFTERSNVHSTSVSSLACGNRVLSVANLDEAQERIHITSSQGPSRDKRNKPDIAAPGTDIIAAKAFAGPDDLWTAMTGTSMASPYVAGVAALMLAIQPKLTATQIEGIVQGTSRPLPGGSFAWVKDAGFGRITPQRCLAEAAQANVSVDKTPR